MRSALVIASVLMMLPSAVMAQGLVREPEELYKSFPVLPTYRDFLPPQSDLSGGFPPAGNQGNQGSCVAWAVGYDLRSYYEGRREATVHSQNFTRFWGWAGG